jgi:hypothetical protein
MQDLQIRTYLALEELGVRMAQKLAEQDGQTGAEYVGILAFVAAVVGVIIAANSAIGQLIVSKITELISSIGG